MRFEYIRHNWVRHTYEKKLPDLLRFLPGIFWAIAFGFMVGSVVTAYKTVGQGSFLAAYLAVTAFFAAGFGIWIGIVSFRKRIGKKWVSLVTLGGNGLILLTVLALYGMGL
ncbi:MAG: hypothetical protein HFI93_08830 [Lachnospiraceae bacterium]|nr:hypothetical protein [Lachnospiraceae bacterium]